MTRQGSDRDDDSSQQPWHNRTPAVLGASILGLAAIGILVLAMSFVARQVNTPEQAPLNFVEPSFSATATPSATESATPTTQTITSTSPPQTTDLSPTSETSSSETSSETSSEESTTRDDDEDDDTEAPRTTRRGPRTNVTRTLYPLP